MREWIMVEEEGRRGCMIASDAYRAPKQRDSRELRWERKTKKRIRLEIQWREMRRKMRSCNLSKGRKKNVGDWPTRELR